MPFVSGLDLGQALDFSALAVCEQAEGSDPLRAGASCWHYAVRYLVRWPLGTPYVGISGQSIGVGEQVKALYERSPLPGTLLAVDQTGVGRAVVDLLRALHIGATLIAVTITAGEKSTKTGWEWHVPKRELVGTLQTMLQCGRLKIAQELPLRSVLEAELAAFRVKQKQSGHESFESLLEKDHDDLLLALAMALWLGEQFPPWSPQSLGRSKASGQDAPRGTFLPGSLAHPPKW